MAVPDSLKLIAMVFAVNQLSDGGRDKEHSQHAGLSMKTRTPLHRLRSSDSTGGAVGWLSRSNIAASLAEVGVSSTTFVLATYITHAAQLPFGVTSHSRILGLRLLPNLLGLCSVSVASYASLAAADAFSAHLAACRGRIDHRRRDRALLHDAISPPAAALLGCACFLALGGCFDKLSPSHVARLGPFACKSIPATLDKYATSAERLTIQGLGRQYGCHSCGTRWPGAGFIADHMPPVSEVRRANAAWWRRLLRMPMVQRFFPQCRSCSSRQAALLAEHSRLIDKFGWQSAALRSTTQRAAVLHAPGAALCRWSSATGALLTSTVAAANSGARFPTKAIAAVEVVAAKSMDALNKFGVHVGAWLQEHSSRWQM